MKKESRMSANGERGSILLVTLLIVFAVAVIGSTIAAISSMDLKISGNQRVTTEAFTVAEAGLAEAIHRLSLRNPTTATIGGWTGNVAISDSEPYDPNWETRLYLTDPGAAPAGGGSVVTTGTIQDPNQQYFMYSQPSGTDNVLTIRHKWIDRDGDGVRENNEIVLYDQGNIPPENFVSGFPVEVVTVTGRAGNSLRSLEAEVTRRLVTPLTRGALYTDRPVTLSGTSDFCGHNHDINTPPGTALMGCFAWHLVGNALPGVTSTGDDIDVGNSPDVLGSPVARDSSSANPWYGLAEMLGLSTSELADILANPDHTSQDANPMDGITYIQGDADINSNLTGSGLLYITGNARFNGGFEFTGLVYVEGDVRFLGGGWILGSLVVSGDTDYGFAAGNAAVLYSLEAIQNAVSLSLPAVVLSWREL
ncbi:MAG: pilus assembly PilX N-terminal domain-containing protein [Candidatus Krumholzibacteria bacterium]|nr:pilus assembly PilX N-terminal domain-containing protein [Candidatus Krumholzibacteria bacterium]